MEARYVDLVVRINHSGTRIHQITDLFSIAPLKGEVISIMANFLMENPESFRGREDVIRALARKEARGIANDALFCEFGRARHRESQTYLWAIGNTIEVIVKNEDFEPIQKIVSDPANGMARQMFVLALGKIKTSSSESILISLLDDNDVQGHAIIALRKLKSQKAKDKINELLKAQNAWVRKEASKFLKSLEGKVAKP